MGNKVSPNVLRYGFTRKWNSCWFNSKHYGQWVIENFRIKEYVLKTFSNEFKIVDVKINRSANQIFVHVYTIQIAVLIANKERNLKLIESKTRLYFDRKVFKKRPRYRDKTVIIIKPEEIRNSNRDAQWIANHIASELAERKLFRVVQKSIINRIMMQTNIHGIKTKVSGRLNMANIARSEGYLRGKMPFNTLRSDIYYAFAEAHTAYGIIGVKVWLNCGSNYLYSRNKREN